MAGARPPANFARSRLEIEIVPASRRFSRIYSNRYPDPTGYSKSPSRFSDPRRRVSANRFGVLYLGETLKVCFLEAVLRDQRDGVIDDLPMELKEIETRRCAEIETTSNLRFVDLRENNAIRMGVPTDVARSSRQHLARIWSQAFYEHPSAPDGVIYPSRLNGHTNLAIYDRAVTKLRPVRVVPLIEASGLADVLDDLRVSLIEPD